MHKYMGEGLGRRGHARNNSSIVRRKFVGAGLGKASEILRCESILGHFSYFKRFRSEFINFPFRTPVIP